MAGSRVPVRRLWVWHRGGATVETLLKRYPNLGPARVLDALAFAYDNQDLIEADIAREQALFEQQGGPTVGARPLSQLSLPFDGEPDGSHGSNGAPPSPAAASASPAIAQAQAQAPAAALQPARPAPVSRRRR